MAEHGRASAAAEEKRHRDAMLRHATGVGRLLERRGDLAGVVAMADLIHESTRWAA
ncbi:hypothetical protein [Nocardioides dongxiaopingii]|uniref:hypothetical protein n=1 Tax=Nocardioides sp. S-1144 TaxID=2582905 RepID=UPI001652AD67|nr:hypothetical protein [Nocardioides sp. S-1144]